VSWLPGGSTVLNFEYFVTTIRASEQLCLGQPYRGGLGKPISRFKIKRFSRKKIQRSQRLFPHLCWVFFAVHPVFGFQIYPFFERQAAARGRLETNFPKPPGVCRVVRVESPTFFKS
jgi:hypothetical protein